MATRLYLSATSGGTAVSPAFDAGWEVTTSAQRRVMSTTKDGSIIASKTTGNTGAAAIRDILNAQFISATPLQAQTITGNITAQLRGNMSSITTRTGSMTMIVKVISPAGVVRGTLYSSLGVGIGTDYTTALTNRSLTSTALSSVAATAGDYLVIEIGWTYETGTNTATTATQSFGSSSGTDLPVNNTTTTANTPWIEISTDLQFISSASAAGTCTATASLSVISPTFGKRFYFSSSNSNNGTFYDYSLDWENTAANGQFGLSFAPDSSSIQGQYSSATGGVAIRDLFIIKFTSERLKAQTISGTFKAQIMGFMSSITSRTGALTMIMRVFSDDGTVVRGTLYNSLGTGATTNLTTGFVNRSFAASLSSIAVQDGDRIVMELGWTYKTGTDTATTAGVLIGANAGQDLPEDNIEVNQYNPWVEFSNDILLEYYMTAVTAGTSTATATLTAPAGVASGTAAGASTATATLTVTQQTSATAIGTSTTTATLTNRISTSASGAGSCTVTATLILAYNTSGTATGTSIVSAALTVLYSTSAVSQGTSTATATLTYTAVTSATAVGTSSAVATPSLVYSTSASAAGSSIASATLNVTTNISTSATAAGLSTASATLTTIFETSATATGSSVVNAVLNSIISISAQAVGIAAALALLIVSFQTSATAIGTSTADADLDVVLPGFVSASATGSSTADATLTVRISVSATTAGVAGANAVLINRQEVTAESNASSAATAVLNVLLPVLAASQGTSTATASLAVDFGSSAISAGISTVTAQLECLYELTAISQGTSVAQAVLSNIIEVTATASGTSTATAHVLADGETTATAHGTSTATATLGFVIYEEIKGNSLVANSLTDDSRVNSFTGDSKASFDLSGQSIVTNLNLLNSEISISFVGNSKLDG